MSEAPKEKGCDHCLKDPATMTPHDRMGWIKERMNEYRDAFEGDEDLTAEMVFQLTLEDLKILYHRAEAKQSLSEGMQQMREAMLGGAGLMGGGGAAPDFSPLFTGPKTPSPPDYLKDEPRYPPTVFPTSVCGICGKENPEPYHSIKHELERSQKPSEDPKKKVKK